MPREGRRSTSLRTDRRRRYSTPGARELNTKQRRASPIREGVDMAVSQVQANNVVIKWRKRIYREWRRANYFSPYMGESASQHHPDLPRSWPMAATSSTSRSSARCAAPASRTGPLTGNEEPLDEYGMRIWVDWIRNAVLLTRAQMRKIAYEQLDEVRPLLSRLDAGADPRRDHSRARRTALGEPSRQLGLGGDRRPEGQRHHLRPRHGDPEGPVAHR